MVLMWCFVIEFISILFSNLSLLNGFSLKKKILSAPEYTQGDCVA